MNEHAREVILKHYSDRRSIAAEDFPVGAADAICSTSAPYLLMVECLDQLDPTDPIGGLLATMIDRAHGVAAGALALSSIGHIREAEILSRSLFESSVTTHYIASESPGLRLAQFFHAYVREERRQNRKWEADLGSAPHDIRDDHVARIKDKDESLDWYEKVIDQFAAQLGLEASKLPGWPGLIDKLSLLGRRVEYRTVYAAMCSQAHHDAEDVLNNFVALGVEGQPDLAEIAEGEADTFSLFMLLCGLRWFVEATGAVGGRLGFPTVVAAAAESLEALDRELSMVVPRIAAGAFPDRWKRHAPSDSHEADGASGPQT